ncbi:putative mitochondrial hypothetical protein [Leptomonas pyrrhocoris]|uniref:Uncharacterized protein n=1 Tax=Leptomonas pyrrhocoris TaxID=157538 RepID=A0A0M9FQN0_LEPPY|nr:putative mitochondrial hypothetical protein [Leptomonas pyrrhocoris]KPA73939.1 putative mitochondrial hypothetical protein [Leptomonas pyrrhocoris]|eukprot:XP_015652378.1 putative mitochondrial hypothetical protein [Leptomonas pyrrhocoris]
MAVTRQEMLDAAVFFEEGRRPSQPLRGHGFLLHGARASGKTSLAFQAAINTVQREGERGQVVVLCQESAFYAKVPVPFTPLGALSPSELGRIEFVYVESWSAALRELMELRTLHAVPPLLLIDDDGFEVETPSARLGRSGQHADVLTSTAAAACLSYLENIHDWITRNRRPFSYVLVTNALPESATRLALPYAAFPLVSVWVGASGVVQVTPVPCDPTVIAPAYLTWRNGLQLR